MESKTKQMHRNDTEVIEIIDLHQSEVQLIRLLRNNRFGQITIKMQDGLPFRVLEVQRFFDMSS